MFSELYVSPDIFSRPFPRFGKPKIIGYLSIDGERNYHGDSRNIKFTRNFENKSVEYDLNLKINEANRRLTGLNEKINHLLYFLQQHELRLCLSVEYSLEKSKFFCYRGLLTLIACTPYENNEPWKLVAVLFKGNIYMCSLDTKEKIRRQQNMSQKEKLCTAWGYKFEQFILTDKPGIDPDPYIPQDENEEFNIVLTTQLNNHTLVYGAEMDGVLSESNTTLPPSEETGPESVIKYLSKQTFIELKTSRHIETPQHNNSFRRYKAKKWWCQSFLANVNTIMCGFRNDAGIVEELKLYQLKDLVKMSVKFWSPDVMFNFLDTFLTFVKRCLEKEIRRKYGDKSLKNLSCLPVTALHFEWSPKSPVRVTDSYSHDDDPVLPPWFTQSYGKPNME